MNSNLSLFVNLHNPLGTKNVIIPSGELCKIEKIGDIILSPKITLKDIYYIPSFKINLLLVHKLTKDNDLNVIFIQNKCIFQNPHSRSPIGQGCEQAGFYIFEANNDSRACGAIDERYWHTKNEIWL